MGGCGQVGNAERREVNTFVQKKVYVKTVIIPVLYKI